MNEKKRIVDSCLKIFSLLFYSFRMISFLCSPQFSTCCPVFFISWGYLLNHLCTLKRNWIKMKNGKRCNNISKTRTKIYTQEKKRSLETLCVWNSSFWRRTELWENILWWKRIFAQHKFLNHFFFDRFDNSFTNKWISTTFKIGNKIYKTTRKSLSAFFVAAELMMKKRIYFPLQLVNGSFFAQRIFVVIFTKQHVK